MKIPSKIEFRHVEETPALRQLIVDQIARLAGHRGDIVRCTVLIDMPNRRAHSGRPLVVGIRVAMPRGGIDISWESTQEEAYAAIRHAFDAALRKLDATPRRYRCEFRREAENSA